MCSMDGESDSTSQQQDTNDDSVSVTSCEGRADEPIKLHTLILVTILVPLAVLAKSFVSLLTI